MKNCLKNIKKKNLPFLCKNKRKFPQHEHCLDRRRVHSSELSNRKIDLFVVRKQVGLASFYRRKLPIIYPLHCFSPTFSHSSAGFLKNFNSVLSGKLKLNEVEDFTLLYSWMMPHFSWTHLMVLSWWRRASHWRILFLSLSLNRISRASVLKNWINFVLALNRIFKWFCFQMKNFSCLLVFFHYFLQTYSN